MKKVTTIFILIVLLLTSCANPNPPLDGTGQTAVAPMDSESTTPEDYGTTTPKEEESTKPQESESDTTEPIPPKDLLTVFPDVPRDCSWDWIEKIVMEYSNKNLNEITPINRLKIMGIFADPFGYFQQGGEPIRLYSIQQVLNLPIENITITDESHLCIAYKLYDAEHVPDQYFYFYQIFETPDCSVIETTIESYFASNSLQYAEFSDFQIGDTLEELKQIVPQIHLMWNGCEEGVPLLLEDGVLVVGFEAQLNEDNTTTRIANYIQFYPNGTDAEINGQKLSILKATNRPPLPGEDN
ncbi:MAG: hypothetical protein IJX80_04445 [Clostridia bacterium]|nr:hypothetical protein [Clostridia bacterium]